MKRAAIREVARAVVRRMDTRRRFADHQLTHEQLWRIMQTCAAPKVARAIRRAK